MDTMDNTRHIFNTSERPKDECGVFGLYRHPEAAKITYFGLYALQHRGQESAGISVNRGINDKIFSHKGMGLVPEIFDMEDLERIEGGSAIGHVRYSTTGDSCDHQCPALCGQPQAPLLCPGPQRQPGQCPHPERRAGGKRLHLPDHHGFGGVPPPVHQEPGERGY